MGKQLKTPQTPDEWEVYYDLRYRVLREPLGQARGSERNDGDETGIHIALYSENKLCGIARLDGAGEQIAQVRFVAVETAEQGKGHGKELMREAERIAKAKGSSQMLLHARDYAVDFYEHIGYVVIEPSHLLFGILQHFKMVKELN